MVSLHGAASSQSETSPSFQQALDLTREFERLPSLAKTTPVQFQDSWNAGTAFMLRIVKVPQQPVGGSVRLPTILLVVFARTIKTQVRVKSPRGSLKGGPAPGTVVITRVAWCLRRFCAQSNPPVWAEFEGYSFESPILKGDASRVNACVGSLLICRRLKSKDEPHRCV